LVWYPDFEDLKFVNNLMIDLIGGHRGVRNNYDVFEKILEHVKDEEGIFRKAAVLLRRLRFAFLFEDANKRTAYVATRQFLEMNGESMKIRNLDEALRSIKDLGKYDLEEIEDWLRHGSKREG